MICVRCGAKMKENAKFCSECGFAAAQKKKDRYCKACGAKMKENQMFCTECGTLFAEQGAEENDSQPAKADIPSNDAGDAANKSYKNLQYAVETKAPKKMKMCNIFMKEEQMEIKRQLNHAIFEASAAGVRVLGPLGGTNVGAKILFGGELALMNKKYARMLVEITIPYKDIANLEKGMYIKNPTIIITLQNGSIYTIAVGEFQEEIWRLMEDKTKAY